MPPTSGGLPTLYGEGEKSINRRGVLAGLSVALATPAWARVKQVKAIGWSGSAMVFDGPRVIELGVRTRVEPFVRARSISWLTREGEASARTLVIEPADGWMEQGGQRKPLPPALIAHERQQYGLYGYLLDAPTRGDAPASRASQPGFPPISMEIRRGLIIAADYTVGSPVDGSPLAQHLTFEGEIREHGVRWFKQMTIAQAGRRSFELWISDLTVERA